MAKQQQPQPGLSRFYLLLVGIAVVGAGVLGFLAMSRRTVSIPVDVTVLAADTAGFRGYLIGSPDAPVEITEYADFQCPACQDFATIQFPDVRSRLIETGKLRWRYRDFPLDDIHPFARLASHSAACADEQGRFEAQFERINQGHGEWNRGGANGAFRRYAEANGLDMDRYDECMRSTRYAGRIQASLEEGVRLGVSGTPTFLLNGRLYTNGLNSDEIRALVDSLIPAPTAP